MICRECGAVLTDDEKYYLEDRCEQCELEWSEAIDRWRRGEEENPNFDELYGEPERALH